MTEHDGCPCSGNQYAKVEIRSGGTSADTVVLVDGKPLDGVLRVVWELEGNCNIAVATLTIENVTVDVEALKVRIFGADEVDA